MKEKLLKQAEREYSPAKRLFALAVAAAIFLGVLPFALTRFSSILDTRFLLPTFRFGVINAVGGLALMLAGWLLAIWAIYVQFTIGRGTPVPVMATQELIVQKPYNYCRNPMALGAIVLYLGLAILLGSLSAVGLVFFGAALLLTYIKFLEEKEMELRFGEAYEAYRKATPFILPRFK